MPITITRAEVKRKCMIPASDTTYDSDIDTLIAEMQPSVEYTIDRRYLDDTADTGLQATLRLGILEIISGEFLQQLYREAGAAESFSISGVTVGARPEHGRQLIAQGASRIAPFRKDPGEAEEAGIATTTSDTERAFTMDAMRGW